MAEAAPRKGLDSLRADLRQGRRDVSRLAKPLRETAALAPEGLAAPRPPRR